MSNKLSDIGWKHGIAISVDKKKTQCNYCHKKMSGGVTRLKQHIAGVQGEVTACQKCPKEIVQMMNKILSKATQMRESRKRQGDEMSRHEQSQLRSAMKKSRRTAFHEANACRHSTSNMAGRPFTPSQFGAGPSRGGNVEPPTSERARDAWDSQTSRGKEVYQGNSEEENPGSGSESSDSGGEGGGGGGEFSGGGDDGDEDEYDGRGGGSYLDSTQVETQTWQKGRIIDSTDQTGHVNESDWREEVYQKIKTMKEIYLTELSEMYPKIVTKIEQDDSLLQQPKTQEILKLKIFKMMLERIMAFLQIPKNGVSAKFKERVGCYEKQIITLLNSRKAVYLLQQGELPPPHMHSMQHSQQAQSQINQVQPHENQMNPQLQTRNLQGSVTTIQQDNTSCLQHGSPSSLSGVSKAQQNMINSLQLGFIFDSGISNDLSDWDLSLWNPGDGDLGLGNPSDWDLGLWNPSDWDP